MKELIETIAQSLVEHPEHVRVEQEEWEGTVRYTLFVDPDEIGIVIGKKGRVINAIRSLVYAARGDDRRKIIVEVK